MSDGEALFLLLYLSPLLVACALLLWLLGTIDLVRRGARNVLRRAGGLVLDAASALVPRWEWE